LVDEGLGENARDGGRDLGVHLVGGDFEECFVHLDGVPHVLQPLGDGSFGDALTQVGHAHRGGRPGGFPAGRGGGRRLAFGLGRGFGGGLGLGGGFGGGFGLGGGVVGVTLLLALCADEGDFRPDVDGFVLVDEDLGENARDGGRDLGVHLVGGDFEEWF